TAGRPRRRARGAARRSGGEVQAGGHRRRPDALPLARSLRDRVDGLRQARRHTPRPGGGGADRGGLRPEGADRGRDEGRPGGEAASAGGVRRAAQAARRGGPRLRRARPRPRQGRRPLHRDLPLHTLGVFDRLKELLRHSAIYGLGSIVARIVGVLLLPLYTRYLSPSDYGLIETLVALSAVLTAFVAQGMKSAFFRFYFDSAETERRLLVVRTAFWYVLAASSVVSAIGIVLAPQVSWLLFGTHGHGRLVTAAFIGLWAALNYEQLTSLFRVEQRSRAYVAATLANVGITIAATVVLVVV